VNRISFTVFGKPEPKGRPRAYIRNGCVGMYTPENTVLFEHRVAITAKKAMTAAVSSFDKWLDIKLAGDATGPIQVNLKAYFQIPKSWSKKKQAAAMAGQIWHTTKPDKDNIEKAVCDALNGILYKDDSQVVRGISEKLYGIPRVEVEVIALDVK
jgi:Holliday junction resolvase RusA-like endonuclease